VRLVVRSYSCGSLQFHFQRLYNHFGTAMAHILYVMIMRGAGGALGLYAVRISWATGWRLIVLIGRGTFILFCLRCATRHSADWVRLTDTWCLLLDSSRRFWLLTVRAKTYAGV
jgi:hypothetical protein